MPPQVISAVLEKRMKLTDDVYELAFKLIKPEELPFRAGQFVNIRVDDGNPKIFFRSYSIMSPPEEIGTIRTCIKLVPTGRATPWLTTIPEGTAITMMGALGIFKYHEQSEKETIFVATGTGITPLRCMLEDQLQKGNMKKMHLIWGFRFEKDIFYKDELKALHEAHPNFTYTITLSRGQESWKGANGRVTQWLMDNIKNQMGTEVYICGVSDMVTDAVNICEKIGLPKEDIHFERYD